MVIRLITWGVPITWAFAAAFAALPLGMSAGAALMTGAILVVLFLVRASGILAPVTQSVTPAVEEGDTMILLSPPDSEIRQLQVP